MSDIIELNIKNEVLCKKHNKKFKGFSKFFLYHYCKQCFNYKNELSENDIIRFKDIKIQEKIEEVKIKKLIEKIEEYNETTYGTTINNYIFINNQYELFSKEEEKRLKILINIIINDFNHYPNFSSFFNIKNLFHFFNIEDKSIIKEGNTIIDDNLIEKTEPIIIEYINDISNRTKLFSKIFTNNNKNTFKIEIEGKILNLIEDYEFKTKQRKVRVKLYLNKNISEINLYKMFANCTNLIYVNGISKLKKIVNIDKIFYNCISLSSIPDLKDWDIRKNNGYLMFYNCISFIFFPYEKEELNINKYDDGLSGILLTQYLKYNKEIIISNINENNEGYINLFKNRIKIEDKNKEIKILPGKDVKKERNNCLFQI